MSIRESRGGYARLGAFREQRGQVAREEEVGTKASEFCLTLSRGKV
jgi:hypothetical protein